MLLGEQHVVNGALSKL